MLPSKYQARGSLTMTNARRVYIIWMYDEDIEDWAAVSVADSEVEAMEYIGDREDNYDGLILGYTETSASTPSQDT